MVYRNSRSGHVVLPVLLEVMQSNSASSDINIDLIKREICGTETMLEGLHHLKALLKPYGVRDLIYVYMLHPKSYVRNDFLWKATFPDEIHNAFMESGGAAAQNIMAFLPLMTEPVYIDIRWTTERKSRFFSHSEAPKIAIKMGYKTAWMLPIQLEERYGYGGLGLYEDHRPGRPKMNHTKLLRVGKLYHETMRECQQMAAEFSLSLKERQTLASISRGNTAADIALETGLVERTIEQRLSQARKKLHARTTTEAVYKSLIYGIIPILEEAEPSRSQRNL